MEWKMEISAVYWESKIKTYGFQSVGNLSLLEFTLSLKENVGFGPKISDLDNFEIDFDLVLVQNFSDRMLRLCLIFPSKWEGRVLEHIYAQLRVDNEESIRVESPVELIYFQGPHFGDRFGIADSAFKALLDGGMPVLAFGCSGSAIYLVFPENGSEKAKNLLSPLFEVPKTVDTSVFLK